MAILNEAEWIQQLTGNPFVLQHSARLVPVLLLGLNAWVDSNRLDAGPVRDVLKGQWHEGVHVVALLTGGFGTTTGIRRRSTTAPARIGYDTHRTCTLVSGQCSAL